MSSACKEEASRTSKAKGIFRSSLVVCSLICLGGQSANAVSIRHYDIAPRVDNHETTGLGADGSGIYYTTNITTYIGAETQYVAWGSHDDVASLKAGGTVINGGGDYGVNDYIGLTITNVETGVSIYNVIDYNDANGNPLGPQQIILGEAYFSPDVLRTNHDGIAVVLDEPGAFGTTFGSQEPWSPLRASVFSAPGNYIFSFNLFNELKWGPAYGNAPLALIVAEVTANGGRGSSEVSEPASILLLGSLLTCLRLRRKASLG